MNAVTIYNICDLLYFSLYCLLLLLMTWKFIKVDAIEQFIVSSSVYLLPFYTYYSHISHLFFIRESPSRAFDFPERRFARPIALEALIGQRLHYSIFDSQCATTHRSSRS